MNWILLTIASAVLLGFYDVFKKTSVRENAVPICLLASTSIGALCWMPMLCWHFLAETAFPLEFLNVQQLSLAQHVLIVAKSILVGMSWSFAFASLKHLPLSIAGPIRSTSPLWTILIAVAFLGERPATLQWFGIIVVLFSFYAFSLVGRREGIHFHRDRYVAYMIVATLLGSFSSIYDKYLLQVVKIDTPTLQAWFSVYLVPVMLPMAAHWYVKNRHQSPFQWRHTIPLIAISLLTADFLYFSAVAQPDALISIISPIRRTAVLIPFLLGIRFFGEKNFRAKAICVVGLLFGVVLLSTN